jgi:hypothetical protein
MTSRTSGRLTTVRANDSTDQDGKVDLDDPSTTLALLKINSVVDVTGIFDRGGAIRSMGIQCAFCHSTVDGSFAPGIGKRLDAWANRDLNVGAIVSLAPNLKPFTDLLGVDAATMNNALGAWGPAGSMRSSITMARRSGPTGGSRNVDSARFRSGR